jgi:hypothetical protein
MPKPARLLLNTLESADAQSAGLTSHLLLDADYTRALIDGDYRDPDARCDEIEAFLFDYASARPSG